MTTALVLGTRREAPTPEPLNATLLDTINVIDGRVDGQNTVGLYTSLNCLPIPDITQECVTPVAPTLEGLSVVDGVGLVADLAFDCQTLGLNWQEIQDSFSRVFTLRESAAVESALMALRFTGTAGGAAADDLTPASGAVAPLVGMAILEGNASRFYAGSPTLHLPRTIASIVLSTAVADVVEGNKIRTALGSKVVAGAGYENNIGPTGAAAPTGEMWLYATGEMTAVRGPRIQVQPQMNRSTNRTTVRAQRPYVVDVDCYLTAVRVKIQ